MATPNPWLTGTHSSLITVNDHDIFLSATGPDRAPNTPVCILFSGLGGSTTSWLALIRLLSPFIRVYIHDRPGLGQSPIDPTAQNYEPATYAERAAIDLDQFLQQTGIEGPFILLPTSYGGILAREFLERRGDDVVGMVMVETCQEKTDELRPIDVQSTMAMLNGIDFFELTGVYARQKLTSAEWQAQMSEMTENGPQTAVERFAWPLTERTLGKKKQFERQILGDRPLSIVKGNAARDFLQVYEVGVAAGNGTEEQRENVRKMLVGIEEKEDILQREQMKLSSVSRFVQLEEAGHMVILEEPDKVAEEVKWVLERCGR